MNTGELIKRKRQELGYSAEEVAEKIGVSPSTIYRYESNNISNMGIDKLKAIANVLGTDAHVLLGWQSDIIEETHENYYKQVAKLPVAEALQFALSKDPDIGNHEYTSTELLEILNFAKFVKERD